jgi:hypothetical protein
MGKPADQETLEVGKHRWREACKVGSIIIGSILLCFFLAWVIGCTNKASIGDKLPEIISFQGDPAGLNQDGSLSYTFEVNNATKIEVVEAGATIKDINGPASGIYKGTAKGHPSSVGPNGERSQFDAVLIASNANGSVKEPLTISFQSAVDSEAAFALGRITCCGPQYIVGQQPPGYTICGGPWPHPWYPGLFYACYNYHCPGSCLCRTPIAAALQGLNKKCSETSCGVTTDNITEYCYTSDPCDPGCICTTPENANMEGLTGVKCSEEPCGITDNGTVRYCYHTSCPCLPGCTCITPEEATAQGLNTKCSEDPCVFTNSSDNVTRYCYRYALPHCTFPCTCLTPAQAAAWNFTIKCSEDPCEVTSDNVTKYCYRSTLLGCGYPCTCLTPEQASEQGFSVQCSSYQCGSITDNTTRHCYQDPSPCHCRGWDPVSIYWQGSPPGKDEDVQNGEMVTIDAVTPGTEMLIVAHPCSTGGCNPLPHYTCHVFPPTGPTYQIYSPDPAFIVPVQSGSYTIALNATCGSESCPGCKFYIQIGTPTLPTCSCQGWEPISVSWTGSSPGEDDDVTCGETVTIDTVTQNTNVVIGSNPCHIYTINSCEGGQTFSYTVTPPAGSGLPLQQGDGGPATFVPATTGTYTVALNATCGGTACPTCTIYVAINNLVTAPCVCKGLSIGGIVSWGGSSPGPGYGLCGGDPVVIPSLTQGEPVQINEALAKCGDSCQPPTTYTWLVTPPSGPSFQSGPSTTNSFSFIPTSTGNYQVLIQASCGGTPCPPCNYTIRIDELTRGSQAPPAEPVGWFCSGGNVYQGTQAQAAQVGVNWYATQAQAIQACQPMGYCCKNGVVGQTTQSQCTQMGGKWYPSMSQATQACQQPATCWCCAGGKVTQTTQTQCARMGGACYSSQSQAMQSCQQAPKPSRDIR